MIAIAEELRKIGIVPVVVWMIRRMLYRLRRHSAREDFPVRR